MKILFLFLTLWCFLRAGALEGDVLALRTFNGDFIAESYPLPLTTSGLAKHQTLRGDLAGFSLTCTVCVGRTRLLFERESIQIHVILSDHTVSVIKIDAADKINTTVTQAVQLDSECTPLHLMPFTYSSNEFAVICAGLSVQFASIDSNNQLILGSLQIGTGKNGVFFESNSQLMSVSYLSYLGYGFFELYNVHTAELEQISLPGNINCMDNTTSLYTLHSQEGFLLSCTTPDGPTLYVIYLNQVDNARSIQAVGHPHSSPDGNYIVVVSGVHVTRYITADQSVQGKVATFVGRVTKLEFLDSQHVLILTENDEHAVMNLSDASELPRRYPGGLPAAWVWVSPSNHYIYVTESKVLYVFDPMSTEPVYDPKATTNLPQMLLFAEKYVTPKIDPSDDPLQPPKFSSSDPSGRNLNLGAILGGVFSVVALILVIALSVVAVYVVKHYTSPPISAPLQEVANEGESKLLVRTTGVQDEQATPDLSSRSASKASSNDGEEENRPDITSAASDTNNDTETSPMPQPVAILDQTEHSPSLIHKTTVLERQAEQIPLLEIHVPGAPTEKPADDGANKISLSPQSPRFHIGALHKRRPGPDFMVFKENPSASHKTSTYSSAFERPTEEEEKLIHADDFVC